MNELEHFETAANHLQRAENFWNLAEEGENALRALKAEQRAATEPSGYFDQLEGMYDTLHVRREVFESEVALALVNYKAAAALATARAANTADKVYEWQYGEQA